MKTFKFFFMGMIILASMPFTLKGQGPIIRFSDTPEWSLDPADFDIPCLTEKISGTLWVEGFTKYTENKNTWHYIYQERIEGALDGDKGGKYEVRAFATQEWQGSKDTEFPGLKTFNFIWPIQIFHDGKLLLTTWWQWHETWNLKDPTVPVVQFNNARAVCH